MDIYTYCYADIVIRRTAPDIWPYLYDRFEWMSTPGTRKLVSGKARSVGEVCEVVTDEDGVQMPRTERTLEWLPHRRYVNAITVNMTGVDMVAFTHWELEELEENGYKACRVRVHVTLTGTFEPEAFGSGIPENFEQAHKQSTQKKVEYQLQRLKGFMEKVEA